MDTKEYFSRNDEINIRIIEYRCEKCNSIKPLILKEKSKFKFLKDSIEIEHIDPGIGIVRTKYFCSDCVL